ncbi:polyphenol oxidase family protein [Arthrobacter sp. FW306-2-2C-D06B]|uniref:polyphenol oxidase family protein n=1 Tax=Arthrobacter sp. FW306-2-2C-D06B TaxID=2879618 RepID=UPI001F297E3F|nr:polyphenol oxidase family protein [Arthrobacter sp. FW306-2-2C-D06B]UKA60293.1 polyphenol oxidase family protein [Arthrobacter sp. FW306-2-2C-D06B]
MFWWRKEVRPGISVAFSDDDAGNLALHVADNPDDVMARRARLEAAAGLGERHFQYMNQVHGKAVEFISVHGAGPTADAMVSRGQPLAVMVADCVPVVLVGDVEDESDPVLAVVHAGRPGVAADIVSATVVDMRSRGAATISAWVGPSICGACYEVPEQLRTDVAAAVPETWSTTSWGTPALDLPAGVRAQLEALGVTVEYSGECTLEAARLYSYRRNQQTGRFAGLVWTDE